MVLHRVMLTMAGAVAGALHPYANRVQIVGSLRRGKPSVKDFELLINPKPELFDVLTAWAAEGWVRPRLNKNGKQIAWNGNKMKAIEVYDSVTAQWLAADLFMADDRRWALSELIRTGDSDFSRLLVTSVGGGGALPRTLKYADWQLWRQDDAPVPVVTEADAFRAYGLPFIRPYQRDATTLKQWAGLRVKRNGAALTLADLLEAPISIDLQTLGGGRNSPYRWRRRGQPIQPPKGLLRLPDDRRFYDGELLKLPPEVATIVDMYDKRTLTGQANLWAGQTATQSLVYFPADRRGQHAAMTMGQVIQWAKRQRAQQ